MPDEQDAALLLAEYEGLLSQINVRYEAWTRIVQYGTIGSIAGVFYLETSDQQTNQAVLQNSNQTILWWGLAALNVWICVAAVIQENLTRKIGFHLARIEDLVYSGTDHDGWHSENMKTNLKGRMLQSGVALFIPLTSLVYSLYVIICRG